MCSCFQPLVSITMPANAVANDSVLAGSEQHTNPLAGIPEASKTYFQFGGYAMNLDIVGAFADL